jgi:hypothetical protein
VEAGQDPAVAPRIEERQRKAPSHLGGMGARERVGRRHESIVRQAERVVQSGCLPSARSGRARGVRAGGRPTLAARQISSQPRRQRWLAHLDGRRYSVCVRTGQPGWVRAPLFQGGFAPLCFAFVESASVYEATPRACGAHRRTPSS